MKPKEADDKKYQADIIATLHTLEVGKDPAAKLKRSSLPLILLVSTITAVLALYLLYGFSSPATAVVQVKNIKTENVDVAQFSSTLDVNGFVVAPDVATVSSDVTGKITQVLVELGQDVKKGQVVATLDDRRATLELQANESRLISQQALLEVLIQDSKIAESSQTRAQKLLASSLISNETYEVAAAQVITKKINIANTNEAIESLAHVIKINLQSLEDLAIRAPFDGTVTALNANVGEIISPASGGGGTFTRTGICTVTDLTNIEFHFDINERFLPKVIASDKISVSFVSQPNVSIQAKIKQLAPTIDSQTGIVVVIAAPEEPVENAKPGSSVIGKFYAKIAPNETSDAYPKPSVSESAVHEIDGQHFVFVVRNGLAEMQPVNATHSGNGHYTIDTDVDISQVVVWSEVTLSSGQKVTIRN